MTRPAKRTVPRHPELYALVTRFIAGELPEAKFDRLYGEAEHRLRNRANQVIENAQEATPNSDEQK